MEKYTSTRLKRISYCPILEDQNTLQLSEHTEYWASQVELLGFNESLHQPHLDRPSIYI